MRPGRASDARVVPSAVERLIRENGHIFTEAQCKVCSALLISESQRLAHYQVRERGAAARPPAAGHRGVLSSGAGGFLSCFLQSKKHANKVRRYLSIHGGEELAHGKKMKLDAKQVRAERRAPQA